MQEVSGSLAAVKNLHVRVEAGAVHVEGGSQSGITYKMVTRVRTSSEEKARRQFESVQAQCLRAWRYCMDCGGVRQPAQIFRRVCDQCSPRYGVGENRNRRRGGQCEGNCRAR